MSDYKPPKEAVEGPYRLLPAVLDHIGRVTPDRVYATIPVASDLRDGLRDVTFEELRKAVDAFATWLISQFGASSVFETLTFVGLGDLRYPVFFLGCIKAGFKALFVSPSNTAEQNANLARDTDCKHLFFSPELSSLARKVADASHFLNLHSIESFDHWLSTYTAAVPFRKTFEEARFDPILVLHSSGSTGHPRALVQTHQYFVDTQKPYPDVEGRQAAGSRKFNFEGGGYILCAIPLSHMGGLMGHCTFPIYSPSSSVLYSPPGERPTAKMAIELMKLRRVRVFYGGPAILEDFARKLEGLERVKSLDSIVYAGGSLAKSVGDALAQRVNLANTYGATEICGLVTLNPDPGEWDWLHFHPAQKLAFEEDVDGQYELVLYRDPEADYWRAAAGTVLRTEPYFRTKDLFIRHPTKPYLWKYNGRKDDIIVHSTGAKWTPVPSESHILSGTNAKGVLITGNGRPEPALLIEIEVRKEDETDLLEEIWPVVEESNAQNNQRVRIDRSKVAFVKPGTFVRAQKGTIVRKASVELLSTIIDGLYLTRS